MSSPQFEPGERVLDRRTCRSGFVIAVCVSPRPVRVVVELDDDQGLVQIPPTVLIREPDPHVVETAPLAGILETFVTRWRSERPMKGSGFRKPDPSDVEPVSAYSWLTTETGLSRDDLRHAEHPDEYPETELRVADAVVAAIGDASMFHDGTFTIRPRTFGCCGGSGS